MKSDYIHEYRYKAVVIPIIKNKFVVVKDAKYNEITFVVGGCKRNEHILRCGLRELYEETRGVFGEVLPCHLKHLFTFESPNRSKQELAADKRQGVIVTMVYNVFILDLQNMAYSNFNNLQNLYNLRNSINYETNGIYLMSKQELYSANMWRFMKDNILYKL
tara:strand:- start:888 stop:1373 length:486 start_codon:yes stop_codon:yes gene_type:complete